MSTSYSPGQIRLGLLPELECRPVSFLTSFLINGGILAVCLIAGMMTRNIVQQRFESTQIVFTKNPPPPPKVRPPDPIKIKVSPPPVVHEVLKMEAPKIQTHRPEPKPEAVKMEAKVAVPVMRMLKPQIIMQPQPKAAMTAAMPAQAPQVHASTMPVHFGSLFGVTPNPNAIRPATAAAIGNPNGGNTGPAIAPQGVVGSAGIGNGLRSGSNSGVVGRVASAGLPGATGAGNREQYGQVGSAGIPAAPLTAPAAKQTPSEPRSTALEVLSKPPVQYTPEAKQLKVQGDVVLRVTFSADGQVLVQEVVRGLGHGLDQEAAHEARAIRFRPATRNGHPIDLTTDIIITFQLA